MNIVEKYALNCGVKIDKPKIYQKYFPMPINKYIYFDPNVNSAEKNYKYWDQVISLLSEELRSEDVHIIYMNYKNVNPIDINERVINLAKYSLNKNQHAYLINNCQLYLGSPSFGMNVASLFDKKIISICGNANLQNEYPYWSNSKNVKIILPKSNSKPFYIHEDTEDRINTILPEEISNEVLNSLGLKRNKNFKTHYIGNNFNSKTLELVPEDSSVCLNVTINNPVIRMDYFFDENVLATILSRYGASIIITNRPIDLKIIKNYKNNISTIIYDINQQHNAQFIKDLKSMGVPFSLITKLDLTEYSDIKLDYMDLGLIKELRPGIRPKNLSSEKVFYKSNRVLIGKLGRFTTKFDWENNKLLNKFVVPDNDKFWEEDLENLYIYSIDNKA